MPAAASATPLRAYEANVASASSMTWVCSLMMTDAMSSAWPKKSRPRLVKKALDRDEVLDRQVDEKLGGHGRLLRW